ncbi:MAG TPA: DNA-binding domain-containing protein [Pirellulales bacterium]|jgi:hypothetical protein|nr:DNA-binding domain-containing protein [Pirellulales bacterium]
MQPSPNLGQIQRWLQAVITHPGGVGEGIESDEAQQEVTLTPDDVERLILPSRQLSSLERLGIYANAYYARLIECFHEEFPALLHALGEETFDAFVFGYLQTYPSRSYTLGDLSADFPGFLAETRPAGDESDSSEADWADFLVDLATLERAYSEAFDGPGDEHEPGLDVNQLAAITPDRLADVVLVPAASLRLMTLRSPVQEYISGIRHKTDPLPPPAQPTWLALWRRDYSVRREAITECQHALLQAILAGRPLGEAIAVAASLAPDDADTLAGELNAWFSHWATAGFFRQARLP